ncbi:MAG: hypothetical protein ACFE9X_16680 [Promethearchaeota archaeon]
MGIREKPRIKAVRAPASFFFDGGDIKFCFLIGGAPPFFIDIINHN